MYEIKYQIALSIKFIVKKKQKTEMAKDARLLKISGKFQICPVNPSSLSDNISDNDNMSDNLKNKNNVELFADRLSCIRNT